MPSSVIRAGGPHSVSLLSNLFFLGLITGLSSPFSSREGYQSIRLSDQARLTNSSPQYIPYFPLIFAATILSPTFFVIIEPDFDQMSRNFPLSALTKAGPFFSQ